MTQRDESVRQLTIEGGEVSHPPPRPKVHCPHCRKTVMLTARGELRQHNIWTGQACPGAGRRPDDAA